MSQEQTSAPPRETRVGGHPATDAKTALGLFALGALSFLPFFSLYQTGSINDEAVVSLGAVRLLGGEAVYRDFHSHFAPGSYYLTWFFYALLGPTVATTRFLTALITGALGLSVYLLARRCLSPRWALGPYFLMLGAGVTQWPILSYHWLGVLTHLLGTLALLRWWESPERKSAIVCGTSMALAAWTLQSEAAALLLLTGMVAALCRKTMTLKMIGWWFVGCLGATVLLWGPVFLHTTLAEVWTQNVVWALGQNAAQGRSPYDTANITARWAGFSSQLGGGAFSPAMVNWVANSVSYLLVWSCNYLLFYPVFLLSILLICRRSSATSMRILVMAQLTGVLAWSSRQTLLYLNFLTPLFFVLLFWLLRQGGKAGKALALALVLIYGTGYLYQCREAAGYRYPISTPRGFLYSADPGEAAVLRAFFSEARRRTPPGTRAFCYPYAMSFTFLSGIVPTGKMFAVIPILAEDSEVPALVETLDRAQVPYIYHFPWSEATLNAVPYVDKEKFWSMVKQFDQEILEDFEPVSRYPIATIYRRKASQ